MSCRGLELSQYLLLLYKEVQIILSNKMESTLHSK